MSYKVKSFLYFSCLIATITIYYSIDNNLNSSKDKIALAEADVNNIAELENQK